MDVKRILNNDFTILLSRSNEGKTMTILNLIEDYRKLFSGNIMVFGVDPAITSKFKVGTFSSLLELERIKNSIVFIDEVGTIFDLEERKYRKQIESTLRLVNHNGNKLFMSGVCHDFKRFLCAHAKCFMFKGLNISDLINGSLAKEILLQYKGNGVGVYSFELPKDKVLCYDGEYFTENVKYIKDCDLKTENVNLFVKKGV